MSATPQTTTVVNYGLARVLTGTLAGLEGRRVRVEADVAPALPGFALVGLPSAALRESRERVGAALRNAGFKWPDGRITVSLAPADLRKDGAAMDLAIAVAILLASGQIPRPEADVLRRTLFVGELALDGALRTARGTLAMTLDGPRLGIDRVVVPAAAVAELQGVDEVAILPLRHLRDLRWRFSRMGPQAGVPVRHSGSNELAPEAVARSLGEVRGQGRAKRALVIAAAGGHHMVLQGPPGCGKTMLARRLVNLLPDLSAAGRRECRRIRSCAGLDSLDGGRPPLRAPHHTVSPAGLVGGGRPLRPGEVTLAHRGLLLLDEIAEFGADRLDRLRQPLGEGQIELTRLGEHFVLPARFQLVGTANPCPCGWHGSHLDRCRCPTPVIERYRRRLSGPLRDRIDLWVELDRESSDHWFAETDEGEWLEAIVRAREIRRRLPTLNAQLDGEALLERCALTAPARQLADLVADRRGLTLRTLTASLRIARTIADLADEGCVAREHLAEAFTNRPAP